MLALLVLLVVGYLAVVPPHIGTVASHPRPAANNAEAAERVAAREAQEAAGHSPLCHTRLLSHGQKTRPEGGGDVSEADRGH